MNHDLTHASFFSGVGGLDLGLERAGWRTVSFSEIDPYASAVLAERWPGVPNLSDILSLRPAEHEADGADGRDSQWNDASEPWTRAVLWTGGFPCQDLSVAGKRRGMGTAGERTRSGLAYAFLDLVERHRPPAILLENVPGLLSSHRGRDMAALLGRLAELGYGVGYRILDARHFGVPQRRRRVFIVGLRPGGRAGAERAAEVLSVGSRCQRHPAAGIEAGPGTAGGVGDSVAPPVRAGGHGDPGIGRDNDWQRLAYAIKTTEGKQSGSPERSDRTLVVGALTDLGHHGWTANAQSVASGHVIREEADSGGVRAPDGLAGGLDDLAPTLRVGPARPQDGGPGDTVPIIVNALDQRRGGADDNEAQAGHLVSQPIRTNPYNNSDPGMEADMHHFSGPPSGDDPLLPLGLDSHRYRCCGNGVVSDVSEWIGVRLARAVAS